MPEEIVAFLVIWEDRVEWSVKLTRKEGKGGTVLYGPSERLIAPTLALGEAVEKVIRLGATLIRVIKTPSPE